MSGEKKNVWDMKPDDIAVIDGKRYKWKRDFKQYRPTLGRVPIWEIVNVDDPRDKKRAIYGFDVEVNPCPTD